MKIEEETITITSTTIKKIADDPEKTAKAVHLIYVNDTDNGILRIRKGQSFEYILNEKKLDNEDDLKRIKSLVIPPAWENVWICKLSNGHLQATGIDVKKRKRMIFILL